MSHTSPRWGNGLYLMNEPLFPESGSAARPLVKICGLTRPQDAALALELGASFLGIIMTPASPRFVPEGPARELVGSIRADRDPATRIIGVFTTEAAEEIARLQRELDLFAVQVHGPVQALATLLPPSRIIPAIAIRGEAEAKQLVELDAGFPAILADAFSPARAGGTGKVFNHRLVQPLFPRRRVFVAGGLGPANIEPIVGQLRPGPMPYAFDLSSGVEESPGVKSREKMRDFFRRYANALGG